MMVKEWDARLEPDRHRGNINFGEDVVRQVAFQIAGLHAAGAIYHGVALKDGVLASMLPIKGIR